MSVARHRWPLMRAFSYERAASPAEAAAAADKIEDAKFIAGGANLLDLMKLEIERPKQPVGMSAFWADDVERNVLQD